MAIKRTLLALLMSASFVKAGAQTSPTSVEVTYQLRSSPGSFPLISVPNQDGKSVQIARPITPAWLKLAGDTAYPRSTPLVAQFRLDSMVVNSLSFPDSGFIRDSIIFSYPGTGTVASIKLVTYVKLTLAKSGGIDVTPAKSRYEWVNGAKGSIQIGPLSVRNFESGEISPVTAAVAFKQGGAWLALDSLPANAKTPLTIRLHTDTTGLYHMPAGLDTALVIVTSTMTGLKKAADTAVIEIRVWAQPVLAADRSRVSLEYFADGGGHTTDTISVINTGIVPNNILGREPYPAPLSTSIEYPASQPQGWLDVRLLDATTPARIVFSAKDPANLSYDGTLTAFVTIRDMRTGAATIVETRLDLRPGRGTVLLQKSQSDMVAPVGGVARDSITVFSNDGTLASLAATVQYSGTATGWLSARLSSRVASSSSPATLSLTANAGSFPEGRYEAQVNVQDSVSGSAALVTVTFTISGSQRFRVDSIQGGGSVVEMPPTSRVIWTGGQAPSGVTIRFAAGTGGGWLSARVIGSSVLLQADTAGLAQGEYYAFAEITSQAGGATIPVHLSARGGSSTLKISATRTSLALSSQYARTATIAVGGRGKIAIIDQGEHVEAYLEATSGGALLHIKATEGGADQGGESEKSWVTLSDERESGRVEIEISHIQSVSGEVAIDILGGGTASNTKKTWIDANGNKNGKVDTGDVARLLTGGK